MASCSLWWYCWMQNNVWVWRWLNRGCHLAAVMVGQMPRWCLGLWKCLNRCHLATGLIGQVFEVVQMFEQMSFGYTYRDDWTGVWGCGNDWTDVIWLQWWLERGCLRCGNDWTDVVWCDDDWTGVWGCGSGWTDVIWLQWWLDRGCLRCGILAVIEHMSFCCNDWTMGLARMEHAVMTVYGADWTQNKVQVWQWLNRGCHLAAMMIQKRPCVYPVAVTEWRWLKNGCFGTSKIEHRPDVLSVAMIEQRCYLAAMMVDQRVGVGCGNDWAENVIWIYVSDWS